MKFVKAISVFSACVAVISISASVLMMRQKDENVHKENVYSSAVDEEIYDGEISGGEIVADGEIDDRIEPVAKPAMENLPVYNYVPPNSGVTGKFKTLMKQNNDVVGWLRINNTQIDYPLLKDPGDVTPNTGYGSEFVEYNEYYLHHSFNRTYLFEGNIYMDCRNNFGSDESKQSENIVIYGHNMLNGSQFGNLRLYKENGYYQTNPFVYLSSNYKDYEYVIVSYCITSGNADTDFRYWDMEELDTQEDFDYYVNRIKRDQLHDTGVDIHYGDKLLTLSTCHADEDNTRFIVLARRLRDGEVAGNFSTIQKTAPIQSKRKSK